MAIAVTPAEAGQTHPWSLLPPDSPGRTVSPGELPVPAGGVQPCSEWADDSILHQEFPDQEDLCLFWIQSQLLGSPPVSNHHQTVLQDFHSLPGMRGQGEIKLGVINIDNTAL